MNHKSIYFLIFLSSVLTFNAHALRGEGDPCDNVTLRCGGSIIPDAPQIEVNEDGKVTLVPQEFGGTLTEEINSLERRNVSDREVAKAILCAETGSYCFGGNPTPYPLSSFKRSGYDYELDILRAATSLEKRWSSEERARINNALKKISIFVKDQNL